MPLTRGRGLPPLAQIEGVYFALLDRDRIVRCAVTRGALSRLAKKPLTIDQHEFIFRTYREEIESAASRKYDADQKKSRKVTVTPPDLPATGTE
jgi:hypothetical protein